MLFFVYFLVLLNTIDGRRYFDINLESLDCVHSPKYINDSVCYVDKNLKPPKAYIRIHFCRPIKEISFSFQLMVFKSNNERISMFNSANADGCSLLEGNHKMTMLNIFKQIMASFGKLPKCPISVDTRVEFKNISIDTEMFPPYVPEAKWTVLINAQTNEEFLFSAELTGETISKAKAVNWMKRKVEK